MKRILLLAFLICLASGCQRREPHRTGDANVDGHDTLVLDTVFSPRIVRSPACMVSIPSGFQCVPGEVVFKALASYDPRTFKSRKQGVAVFVASDFIAGGTHAIGGDHAVAKLTYSQAKDLRDTLLFFREKGRLVMRKAPGADPTLDFASVDGLNAQMYRADDGSIEFGLSDDSAAVGFPLPYLEKVISSLDNALADADTSVR
jgi:hypothetical protein